MPELPLPDHVGSIPKSTQCQRSRWAIAAFAAISAMLFAGATLPASGQSGSGRIGVSGGEVAGAAIGVGAAVAVVITILVSRSHHVLIGCVMTGANTLELQSNDGKTYALAGDAASIKAGEKVKVHGSKMKKTRDSTGPVVFSVDKLNRDYGSCQVASVASPAH